MGAYSFPPPVPAGRVRIDGKQFAVGSRRFAFRGVTYGTFSGRGDGKLFPPSDRIKRDFSAMNEAGFTVVRTYTEPPDDLLDLAADWDLRVLAGVFYPDWRYVVGASRRQCRQIARDAAATVRQAARRLAGDERVVALVLGNEVPADAVRWLGTRAVSKVLDELVEVAKDEDPATLVTYANYPTAEYLPLHAFDFLTFNVFLESRADLRRYLTRLHHLAGDRPLVLGEIGLDAGTTPESERHQAEAVGWQLETALERGVAGTCLFSWTDEWSVGGRPVTEWRFGLNRADRTPRPSLGVAAAWNRATVNDLQPEWPSLSVVICAYNAEETLDECLSHTCALDYPALEIIVVDDGSTDSTAAIAARHPRARLVTVPHGGLSVARNHGFQAASGELVAYLDSDAYPTPEWPYYLVLAFDGRTVGGAGGPNVPPEADPPDAQVVARSPGGPVHVLLADDRAEHVPGCNMAFWKGVLEQVGGFDPIYTAAGDDVDLCWKVLDRGWDIGFHPAAVVWHHRRAGLRRYLRQQKGYGRAEALVEARHPDRFTPLGTARWRGRIYNSLVPHAGRQRVYRGLYGAAAYQSVYQGASTGLDLAHQAAVPVATVLAITGVVGFAHPVLALPAALAVASLFVLGVVDALRATPMRSLRRGRLGFRVKVAAAHLLQPLARAWARARHTRVAWRGLPPPRPVPGPARRVSRSIVLIPEDRPRAEIVDAVVTAMRRAGVRVAIATGWEDHDARMLGSALLTGDLVSSSHLAGTVQLRVRRHVRMRRATAAAAVVAAAVLVASPAAVPAVAAVVLDLTVGWWRTGPFVRKTIVRAAASPAAGPGGP